MKHLAVWLFWLGYMFGLLAIIGYGTVLPMLVALGSSAACVLLQDVIE